MTRRFAAVLLSGMLAWTAVHAQLRDRVRILDTPPAKPMEGWWIRVPSESPVSQWRFRFTDKRGNQIENLTWQARGETDLQVPKSLRTSDVLIMSIRTEPAEAAAAVCVFYKTDGVRRIDLPAPAPQVTLNQQARDKECTVKEGADPQR